jgi:rubrerythrin
MGLDIGILPGRTEQSYGRNSTSLLVYGIVSVAGAIFAFAVSVSTRNTDPSDFFYDIDNESSGMFALMGALSLIIGLVFVVLSFKVKNDEERRLESQAKADEAARQRDIQDIADAVKSNIKVRCRYCGTLNEEDASKCSACGAAL